MSRDTAVRAFVAVREALTVLARDPAKTEFRTVSAQRHAWAAHHHLMQIESPLLMEAMEASVERCFKPDQLPRSILGKAEIAALRRIWAELSERKARHAAGEHWRSWTEHDEDELSTIELLLSTFGVDPTREGT